MRLLEDVGPWISARSHLPRLPGPLRSSGINISTLDHIRTSRFGGGISNFIRFGEAATTVLFDFYDEGGCATLFYFSEQTRSDTKDSLG